MRRYRSRVSAAIPEPSNVRPIHPGGLRASDADRDQVAAVLSTAYAEGRITKDEHDERLDAVLQARTFDDLIPITTDLVPAPVAQPTVVRTPNPAPSSLVDTSYVHSGPERLVAIFSGVFNSCHSDVGCSICQ